MTKKSRKEKFVTNILPITLIGASVVLFLLDFLLVSENYLEHTSDKLINIILGSGGVVLLAIGISLLIKQKQ